ncbi:MAG: hypothetical protein VKN60_03575 [Cyanobacteriota bacterium]|nr:hypothetical protein [Cyanobacteriota bacterium]
MPQSLTPSTPSPQSQDVLQEYVAELQLHMALHARNLVPPLDPQGERPLHWVHESQALAEKLASRLGA